MNITIMKIAFSEAVNDGLTEEQYDALESWYLQTGDLKSCEIASNYIVLLRVRTVNLAMRLVELARESRT